MRIVMMGTGPFAVPTFRRLLDSDHEILCLVTRPVAVVKGRRNKAVQPMRDVAEQVGLKILDPVNVNGRAVVAQLQKFQVELFVVCDYGQILSRPCLQASKLGGINLHGSLLPKYRGAAPINWALYHGETETGVTVIHMTPQLDGGPMLAQVVVTIEPDETAIKLESRMALAGVAPVLEAIQKLQSWDGESTLGIHQDKQHASRAPRLTKEDGRIDWSRFAHQIIDQIRAFQPWPGCFTNWQRLNQADARLIIQRAAIAPLSGVQGVPGEIIEVTSDRLIVAAHESSLSLLQLQPAGKRSMSVAEFLRGNPVQVGERMA